MSDKIRVRFAPSPTGFMHLGNVRAALINYLFAHQKKGTFILRIEDTDQNRNVDEATLAIVDTLNWLSLKHHEGPINGGPHAPYYQSERTPIYQKHLDELINSAKVYRCFCTSEQLEEKRLEDLVAILISGRTAVLFNFNSAQMVYFDRYLRNRSDSEAIRNDLYERYFNGAMSHDDQYEASESSNDLHRELKGRVLEAFQFEDQEYESWKSYHDTHSGARLAADARLAQRTVDPLELLATPHLEFIRRHGA